MAKNKTILDLSIIPPGKTLEGYMAEMKNMMMMPIDSPIHNMPHESRFNPAERAIYNVTKVGLLHGMLKITDREVERLISMIDSEDEENWHVAEQCIKQKFLER